METIYASDIKDFSFPDSTKGNMRPALPLPFRFQVSVKINGIEFVQ